VRHIGLLVGTLLLRPYVLLFLVWYLLGSVTKVGFVRTLVFASLASTVSLATDLASTRSGLPLGWLRFTGTTHGEELWIAGVPLWTAAFFTVVCWASYQLAVLVYAPLDLRRGDLQVLDTIAIRRSPRVLVTAGVLVAALEGLLAPLEVRGDRWFLGALLAYPEGGAYFGVPATALTGTFLAAVVAIGIYQRVEPLLVPPTPVLRAGQARLRLGGLAEPLLYLGLVVLGIAVAAWLGEQQLAIVGVLIFAPLAAVLAAHVLGTATQATAAEREAHRRDFPRSRILD
jgi:hypothetical protein